MGGFGSGRWSETPTRGLVEDSLAISVDSLYELSTTLPIRNSAGDTVFEPHRSTARFRDMNAIYFRLKLGEQQTEHAVPLSATGWPDGNGQKYFLCPVGTPDRFCGRRCRKLFLPSGATTFGCRGCHGLGYKSQLRRTPHFARLIDDPETICEMLDALERHPVNVPRLLLALRAGRACVREMRATLRPEFREIIDAAFLARDIVFNTESWKLFRKHFAEPDESSDEIA